MLVLVYSILPGAIQAADFEPTYMGSSSNNHLRTAPKVRPIQETRVFKYPPSQKK